MISQRGVELHARIEQRLIRILELLLHGARALAAVDVIAQHDHEIEAGLFAVSFHLLPDVILRLFACSVVSDDRKAKRSLFERETDLLRRRGR